MWRLAYVEVVITACLPTRPRPRLVCASQGFVMVLSVVSLWAMVLYISGATTSGEPPVITKFPLWTCHVSPFWPSCRFSSVAVYLSLFFVSLDIPTSHSLVSISTGTRTDDPNNFCSWWPIRTPPSRSPAFLAVADPMVPP